MKARTWRTKGRVAPMLGALALLAALTTVLWVGTRDAQATGTITQVKIADDDAGLPGATAWLPGRGNTIHMADNVDGTFSVQVSANIQDSTIGEQWSCTSLKLDGLLNDSAEVAFNHEDLGQGNHTKTFQFTPGNLPAGWYTLSVHLSRADNCNLGNSVEYAIDSDRFPMALLTMAVLYPGDTGLIIVENDFQDDVAAPDPDATAFITLSKGGVVAPDISMKAGDEVDHADNHGPPGEESGHTYTGTVTRKGDGPNGDDCASSPCALRIELPADGSSYDLFVDEIQGGYRFDSAECFSKNASSTFGDIQDGQKVTLAAGDIVTCVFKEIGIPDLVINAGHSDNPRAGTPFLLAVGISNQGTQPAIFRGVAADPDPNAPPPPVESGLFPEYPDNAGALPDYIFVEDLPTIVAPTGGGGVGGVGPNGATNTFTGHIPGLSCDVPDPVSYWACWASYDGDNPPADPADQDMIIPPGEGVIVALEVNAPQGQVTHPRSGGRCQVDQENAIDEGGLGENNNTCPAPDTFTVGAPGSGGGGGGGGAGGGGGPATPPTPQPSPSPTPSPEPTQAPPPQTKEGCEDGQTGIVVTPNDGWRPGLLATVARDCRLASSLMTGADITQATTRASGLGVEIIWYLRSGLWEFYLPFNAPLSTMQPISQDLVALYEILK